MTRERMMRGMVRIHNGERGRPGRFEFAGGTQGAYTLGLSRVNRPLLFFLAVLSPMTVTGAISYAASHFGARLPEWSAVKWR